MQKSIVRLDKYLLLLICILFLSCSSENANQPDQYISSWRASYGAGEFPAFLQQANAWQLPILYKEIHKSEDEEIRRTATQLLLQAWIETNPFTCLEFLENLYYKNGNQVLGDVYAAVEQWYSIAGGDSVDYFSNISFDRASWRVVFVNALVYSKYIRDKSAALRFIAELGFYRHFMVKTVVENLPQTQDYQLVGDWLVELTKDSQQDVHAAVLQFISLYGQAKPDRVIEWLEKLSLHGPLKTAAWNAALKITAEYEPEKVRDYLNHENNVFNILKHISRTDIDDEYDKLIENFVTGAIYSSKLDVAYQSIAAIKQSKIKHSLLEYYFYIANRDSYKNVWVKQDGSKILSRFDIAKRLTQQADGGELERAQIKPFTLRYGDREVVESAVSEKNWRYDFYANKRLNLVLTVNAFDPNTGVFLANRPLQISIHENKISFPLYENESVTVHFPGGYKLEFND